MSNQSEEKRVSPTTTLIGVVLELGDLIDSPAFQGLSIEDQEEIEDLRDKAREIERRIR